MKSVRRYQSKLLFRRSYKPARQAREVRIVFRPSPRVIVPIVRLRAESGALPMSTLSFVERWAIKCASISPE